MNPKSQPDQPPRQKPLYQKKQRPVQEKDPDKKPRSQNPATALVNMLKQNGVLSDLTYDQVKASSDQNVVRLVDYLHGRQMGELRQAALSKMISKVEPQFLAMSFEDQKRVLARIVVDDWAPAVKHIAQATLPIVWKAIKRSDYGQKAIQVLRDYTGIDLNDNPSNTDFTLNASMSPTSDWSARDPQYLRKSSGLDGVSTQALASILCPEYTQSRFPQDNAVKTGLLNKKYLFTLPTNASGGAAVIIRPNAVDQQWYQIFNDATFNQGTWAQSVSASASQGPVPTNQGIEALRLTACSVVVRPIVSTLQDQGQLTMFMAESETSPSPTQAPVNATTVRDCEYVVYSALKSSNGHRLTYYNESSVNSNLRQVGSQPDFDFIGIVVTGAQPSTSVLQIQINYQVEYTALGNILLTLESQPMGTATSKALSTILSQRPNIRLLGQQEAQRLYYHLAMCEPQYQAVVDAVLSIDFQQIEG